MSVIHQQNAIHVLNITFSPTYFGAYFAIFRENFFVYAESFCYILRSFMKKCKEWKASRYFYENVHFLQRTQFLSNMMNKMPTACRETAGRVL